MLRSIRYNAVFFPVIEVFSAISVGLVALVRRTSGFGPARSKPACWWRFIQYIQRMYQPIRDLAEKYNIMQAAMASSERIFALARPIGDDQEPGRPKRAEKFAGAVEFKNVQLSYQPGEPVLKGISFRVRPGEKVALVGATGGGKTSIISALCRFYDVEAAQILVDGIDVREWNKQELRRQLGLVLQDVFLFPATSRPTLPWAIRGLANRRMVEAAARAQIAPFIEKLPKRFPRRSSRARFDFVAGTAAVIVFCPGAGFRPEDSHSRRGDQLGRHPDGNVDSGGACSELLKNRTALIVAHRLSTIKHADRILVIHKGEIWEAGQSR